MWYLVNGTLYYFLLGCKARTTRADTVKPQIVGGLYF